MERRFVGGSGLQASVIGFGTMTFGGQCKKFEKIGNTAEAEAKRVVDIAIERGVTLFDTSDNYSGGQSEVLLGKALGAKRDRVVIATQVFGRSGPAEHDIGLSRRSDEHTPEPQSLIRPSFAVLFLKKKTRTIQS